MQNIRWVTSIAAAAAMLCSPGALWAASTTVGSSQTLVSATATSNPGNGGGLATASTTVNFAATGFNPATGVLTGVSATLSGPTVNGGGGASGLREGTETYTLAGSSVSQTLTVATHNGSLSFAPQTLSSFGSLAPFVTGGAGTVASSATYVVSADRTAASGATSATVSGTANQSVTYTYLQHANASFDAGSDVNTLALVATGGGTSFNVNALAGSLGAAHTTRLDLQGVACVSGCGAFALNLPSFDDLAAGGSVQGSVQLLATAAGSYSGQYLLSFTDDTAVGLGQAQNTLTLNVSATVAAVPEPGTTAMLMAGLGVMGFLARRRKA